MDWFFAIIFGGLAALAFFIASVVHIRRGRYALGLGLAVFELLAAAVSASNWAHALRVSGKGDWFLFGLLGYTPLGLICFAMFIVGALCVLACVRGLMKNRASDNAAGA